MRSAIDVNLASSTPVTRSTGIASESRRGHSDCWAPVPARRKLAAKPAAVLPRRSASSRVVTSQVGEQRQGQPVGEERGDAVVLQERGSAFVVGSPRSTVGIVVEAGGGADQDQPFDEVRSSDGEMQGEAAAHRVADVRRPLARAPEGRGAGGQVDVQRARLAVTGGVDAKSPRSRRG